MHCRVISSISGLYAIDTRNTPSKSDNPEYPRHCQMVPGDTLALAENHCFRKVFRKASKITTNMSHAL